MALSCMISQIKRDVGRKSQCFPTSPAFDTDGCPHRNWHKVWYGKTAIVSLPDGGKSLICSAVSIQCRRVTDRQTDDQGRIQDFGLGGAPAGGLEDESHPAGSRGRAPVGSPEECYAMRLKHLRTKKTSPYRLTLYYNIVIRLSSSHPLIVLCFQPFLS